MSDEIPEIVAALDALRTRYDYVITTGGIGPTHDDITADAVAVAFDVELYEHPDILAILNSRWGGEVNAARRRMARVPVGGELVKNPVQGPPGFFIDNVFVLAGVPSIVTAGMVRSGAVVVDVGVSRVTDPTTGKSRVAGDVDASVRDVAAWVSPNPGGVGPMTRAMLLANVVEAAERALRRAPGEDEGDPARGGPHGRRARASLVP